MRYIKQSFKYIYKNGLVLLLFSLVPAIFYGGLLRPFKFIEFINNYSNLTVLNFGDIFFSIIEISWLKLLYYVFAFILFGVFFSIIIGIIENHFRSGKNNYSNIKAYINNNITSVLINIILLFLINFVLSFLSSVLIYLFHVLLVGLNTTPSLACIIIAILIFVIYFCVSMSLGLVFMLNVPTMMQNGYLFKQSISNTINAIGNNYFNLILAYLAPYLVIIPLISIFSFSTILIKIINMILALGLIIYYSAFVMVAYYDINNLPRYDNRKYYTIK